MGTGDTAGTTPGANPELSAASSTLPVPVSLQEGLGVPWPGWNCSSPSHTRIVQPGRSELPSRCCAAPSQGCISLGEEMNPFSSGHKLEKLWDLSRAWWWSARAGSPPIKEALASRIATQGEL